MVPNLRSLQIKTDLCIDSLDQFDQLFDRDVLFSLKKFRLLGTVAGPEVVHHLISRLSEECLYSFNVRWDVADELSQANTSTVLLNTIREMKGRIPMEVQFYLYRYRYTAEAYTVPRLNKSLTVQEYFNTRTINAYVQSLLSVFF